MTKGSNQICQETWMVLLNSKKYKRGILLPRQHKTLKKKFYITIQISVTDTKFQFDMVNNVRTIFKIQTFEM